MIYDCYSAWNNRRSSVTVRHDFMCDRQDSFSAGHNDRQVSKFQQYILYKKPTRIGNDRHEVPTAGHDVWH